MVKQRMAKGKLPSKSWHIETNRNDLYKGIATAPSPSQRYEEFVKVNQSLKMVTIEPDQFVADIFLNND